jgi:uncharacterized protein (TIGR03435 family)
MRTLLLPLVLVAAPLAAQVSDTFEVASIKVSDPLANGTYFRYQPGGGIEISGATLKSLLLFTYDLRDFQLTGAAGWMNSERYTIVGKGVAGPGPATYRDMNDQQRKALGELVRKRMKALLAERFQLAVHTETKELPMYGLVVAKGGHKMTPNTGPDGSPQSSLQNRGAYEAQRASLDSIAQGLASITGRPVKNETGLSGYYDFKVKWTPDAGASAPPGGEERPPEAAGPTIFTALQEQLGLKLESRKGPVEILVVDRAERPSDN